MDRFYLLSYPGTWFSPCSTLSFSYKPLTKWVGRYERNSPVIGSTSSSHNSTDSIDVLPDRKETPARNRSLHFSQVNCVFIVFLQFIFPLCMVFPTVKYLAHNRGNYRLLISLVDNLETYLSYITILILSTKA